MHYAFTRTVSFMLAFGLFIGCSSLSSSQKQSADSESLSREEIESELENINDSLSKSADNTDPDIYLRKGYLLGELAQKERQPAERKSTYREMQQALQSAEQMSSSSTLDKVDEYLKMRWSQEHNQGVKIIQSDSSTLRGDDYKEAAAHFTNAITIIPDSAISHNMKAQTLYRNHQITKAIDVLEGTRNHMDPLPSSILEQLAFLYLETDQKQKAVAAYEEAESFSDENLNIIHGLANAYISIDDHEKAVELLNLLVETEPENIIYAQTLGAELYFLGTQKIDHALNTSNSGNPLTAESYTSIDELFSEAENHLRKALSADSGNTELKQKLAYFYNNSAASYQRMTPHLPESSAEDAHNTIRQYLQAAIPLLESLTQNNPDKTNLWENLYRTYNYLGMSDKAEEIESKINRQN